MNRHGEPANILVAASMILESVARLSEHPEGQGYAQAAEVFFKVAESPDIPNMPPMPAITRAVIRQLGHHFMEFASSARVHEQLKREAEESASNTNQPSV
jgi:hypothetical protein